MIITSKFGPIIDQIEFDIPDNITIPIEEERRSKYISASKIRACNRQWYYMLSHWYEKKEAGTMKPEWRLTAIHGNLIHDQIQKTLVEYDLLDATETYIPKEDGIVGRIDGRLTEQPMLLEIKTMSYAYWSNLPNNAKFESFQDQIQIYLERLNLPSALLVCVRRDPIIQKKKFRTSLCKEFIIPRDRQRGQELLAKAKGIYDYIERDEIPIAEPGPDCRFCSFQSLCHYHDVMATIE